ncbi:MAG: sugar ABC transporter substrate-binding protein [Treponemataceae bacterium]|nr:sugar ABC transporter substrate-binding protein [Treponemataceae bacterium]
MKKFALVLMVLVLAMGMVFAGGKKETKAADNTVTLKWALWDLASTVYYQPLIDAFEAANPGIKIETLDLGSAEYQTMLSTQLTGGDDSIDVAMIKDVPGYATLVNANQLLSLNDFVKTNKIDLSQYAGLADQVTINGNLYELPFRSDFNVVFYNKDLFDAAGVAYPSNDMTWEDFDALARKMTSGTGANKVYGSHYHTWRSMVQCAAFLDGKNTALTPPYDFLKPYYERIIAQQKDGICMDYAELKTTSTHYSGVFYNNSVAMMQMGSWFIPTLIGQIKAGKTEVQNWGIVKLPHAVGTKAGTTIGTITGVAVSSASKHKDEALKFVSFICGEAGAKILAETGTFPGILNEDVAEILAKMEGFPADANSKEALQVYASFLEIGYNPKVSQVEQALNRSHDNIMTMNCTIDEGIATMTAEVKDILGK